MTIKYDTFTEASDTFLLSHISDSGGGWQEAQVFHTVFGATDDVGLSGDDNIIRTVQGNESLSSPHYWVEANLRTGAANATDIVGVVARRSDSSNYYFAQIKGDGTWQGGRTVGGSVTTLMSGSISGFAAATQYNLKLQVARNTLRVSIDSIVQDTVTDSTFSNIGKLGILTQNSNIRITTFDSDYGGETMTVGAESRQSYDARLAFGSEGTWGTGVTGTSFMEFTSQNFKPVFDNEKIESLGTGRTSVRLVRKQKHIEGTLVFNMHPVDGIALIKHAMMGTVTSALAGTTDAYNHTFTAGDLSTITEKGLTFDVQPSGDTTMCYKFSGCRVNSYKVSAAINEVIKCEINFIGKDVTTGTIATTTAAYSPVIPYIFHHGTFKVDTVLENIIGFELMIENNLQNDANARSLGDQTLTVLPPGRRNVSLSLTQRFDTTTVWDRFVANTAVAIQLLFDTGHTIGSTDSPGTTYSAQIDIKEAHYNTGGPPEISEVGILTHEVEMGIIGDTTTSDSTDIVFSVTNSATSY